MLHSIRWRLILSYAALTLLTASLVGIVVLTLITRYMADREQETLAQNAISVAQKARPLLTPLHHTPRLQYLAITSGFMTNTDVQILDIDRQMIASSQVEHEESGARVPSLEKLENLSRTTSVLRRGGSIGPFVIVSRRQADNRMRGMFVWETDDENFYTISIERRPGLWGDRLVFEEPTTFDTLVLPKEYQPSRPFWQAIFGDTEELKQFIASGATVTLPIREGDQVLGYVQMSNRYRLFAEPLSAIRRSLLVAGSAAVLLAVLLGFLMSRSLTAPLLALAGATQQMEGGDLTARAPETVGEIGDVARRFNRMAARLQATFADLAAERDALRHFIADASHELRTPLTALRQFVDLLQGQAANDPATRAEFLAESQHQLERLQWMTGHLLDLSRLDGGVASLDMAQHEVANLLEGVLASFRPLAAEKGIDLRLSMAAELEEIRCDRARMEMVLANLLDNALKYTPTGGLVEITAMLGSNDTTILWVADSGPGIQPGDQERIFERFYRGENNEQLPGSGLGLAIVKSTVEAHGGTVRVVNDEGAKFIVEIPA